MFKLFKKQPSIFSVTHSEGIKAVTIAEAGQLINYVIGVNNTLIEREETGWLLVQKKQPHKKGEKLLFADYLSLPIMEDNPYFENRLAPFYKEKPTAFDPSILEHGETGESDLPIEHEVSSAIPDIPEDLQALAIKASAVSVEDEDAIDTEEVVSDYERQISELKAQLDEKDRLLASVEKQPIATQSSKIEKSLPESPHSPEMSVSDSLSDVVSSALQRQLVKLEHEIKMKDSRAQIESEILNDFQQKKAAAIETKVIELDAEKNINLTQAKEEYEKKVSQIEQEHITLKDVELTRLTQNYEQACQKKVKEATSQQSKELANYFESRKRDLLGWKQSLNQDMESQLGTMVNTLQLFSD